MAANGVGRSVGNTSRRSNQFAFRVMHLRSPSKRYTSPSTRAVRQTRLQHQAAESATASRRSVKDQCWFREVVLWSEHTITMGRPHNSECNSTNHHSWRVGRISTPVSETTQQSRTENLASSQVLSGTVSQPPLRLAPQLRRNARIPVLRGTLLSLAHRARPRRRFGIDRALGIDSLHAAAPRRCSPISHRDRGYA